MTCATPSSLTAIRPGSLTLAPSVPPLPSRQAGRDSALMTAALYTTARRNSSSAYGAYLSSRLDEGPLREVRSEVAQLRRSVAAECLCQRGEMARRALARVVAGARV